MSSCWRLTAGALALASMSACASDSVLLARQGGVDLSAEFLGRDAGLRLGVGVSMSLSGLEGLEQVELYLFSDTGDGRYGLDSGDELLGRALAVCSGHSLWIGSLRIPPGARNVCLEARVRTTRGTCVLFGPLPLSWGGEEQIPCALLSWR